MPYIKNRENFQSYIANLVLRADTKGDINYIITKIVHEWVLRHCGINYTARSEGKSVLQDALDEYKRQVMDKYEDKKKLENDAISELDE